MEKFLIALAASAGFIGILVVGAILSAFPVMILWNILMTAKFGLPSLTFMDALYMSLLCGCLFKSSSSSSSSSKS